MAPGLVDNAAAWIEPASVNKTIFPDGLKTSGQQEPIYSLIKPYEEFPREITGQTVWKAEDFKNNPEKWTHSFTDSEIVEIGAAADSFIEAGYPLTGMAKVSRAFFLSIHSAEHSVVSTWTRTVSSYQLWPLEWRN